jgi:hypothetical protein
VRVTALLGGRGDLVGQVDDLIEAGANSLERTVAIPTRADAVNVGITRCRIR